VNENNLNKKNDIIDAEFVNEESTLTNNSNSNLNENQSNSIKKVNEYHFSDQEFYSSESQQQKFKSFYYSFGNNSNIKLKKPSILKIILLLPFIILGLLFLLIIGLIMFVIFLPKIFNIFRKKGISGLKMDYNLIRGLFSQIRTK
jgi:hypothetical protein